MKAPGFANLCLVVCILSAFAFASGTFAAGSSSTIEPVDRSNEWVKAFADLATFYENDQKTPPYQDSLARLNAPGASGDLAARYILALCMQSLADETNGRGHWKATPFWGEGARSPAHEFRKKLITDFCRSGCGDRALDIALWLVKNDQSSTVPKETLAVFKRGTGAHCVDVYRQLLQQPYSLAELTPAIIDQVGARHLNNLRPEIESLENHYRQSVRNAARRAAQDLGLKPATGFVPEATFTPWLERQVQDINEMVYGTIPPGSRFSSVVLQSKQGEQTYSEEVACWVLKDTPDAVEVLDTFGRYVKFLKHPPTSFFPSMKSILGKNDATWVTSVTPYELKLAAADLVAVRGQLVGAKAEGIEASNRRFKAEAKLSTQGGFTGQFEDRSISVPEALVATWCYVRGDKAIAAQLLFPCIDRMSDDRELVTAVRSTIGAQYYHEMLDKFSLCRDYPGTLALAAHLLKPQFNGAFFQEQVRELASQLKARSSDFNSFSLPQPSQWQHMKEKMSTEEQIDFLAPRLRLLNCRQYEQPGAINFGDPQFKEALQYPESLGKIDFLGWHWRPGANGTEVINPYVELLSIMQNHDNIPWLLPYLKDKNYVVAVGYWRDFHPARHLTRVNDLVAGLINYSAKGTVVDLGKFESLSSAKQDSYLQDVLRWCKAHQKLSKQDLALETARTTKDRNEFRNVIQSLIKDKDTRVLEVFDARYNQFDGLVIPDIAQAIFSLDSPETGMCARKWLARPFPKKPNQAPAVDAAKRQDESYRYSGELSIRFWSALLLLKGDSKDQDIAISGLQKLFDDIGLGKNHTDIKLFKEGYYPFLNLKPAVEQILKVNRKDAHDLACCLAKIPYSNGWPGQLPVLRLLFNAGCPEALNTLTTYLRLPLPKDASYGEQLVNGKAVKYRDAPGDYLVDELVGHRYSYSTGSGESQSYVNPDWGPPGFIFERTESEETKKSKREQLAQYLEKKFQDIKDGKSSPLSNAD